MNARTRTPPRLRSPDEMKKLARYAMMTTFIMSMAGCSSMPADYERITGSHGTYTYNSAATPPPPPRHAVDNACKIARYTPAYIDAARRAEARWGVPSHVILAFVRNESTFRATARSSSGAYGYPQAKDATWLDYQRATGNWHSSRSNIYDAMDFIGWYNYVSSRKLGLSRWDAFRLYLAYHEGRGGYQKRSYARKQWLVRYAHKVQRSAHRYRQQMKNCDLI